MPTSTAPAARHDGIRRRAFFILAPGETVPDYVEQASADAAKGQDRTPLADYNPVGDGPVPQPLMTTIYIGKGKKDKISKGDIVGFLCKKGGLKGSEIGRIDVYQRYAYAAVPRRKLRQVLRGTHGEKIKGVKTIVEEVTI